MDEEFKKSFKETQYCISSYLNGNCAPQIVFEAEYNLSSKRARINYLKKLGYEYDSHIRCWRIYLRATDACYFVFFTKL